MHWVCALVWAGLAASIVYWGLKLFGTARPLPPGVVMVGDGATAKGDPLRLFTAAKPAAGSAEPAAAPASSRFKLIGVVAPAVAGERGGVATLSVDGGPARTYRVGAALGDQLVLQGITQQGVQIGPAGGAATVSLQLPPLQAASRGVPSSGDANAGAGRVGNSPMPTMVLPMPSAQPGTPSMSPPVSPDGNVSPPIPVR